ncbi:MAG: OmpA family protein [Bacteroidota bacterium]
MLAIAVSAQEGRGLKKANRQYEAMFYQEAITSYLDLVGTAFESELLLERLANAYYFNAQYVEAVKWYDRLHDVRGNRMPWEVMLRYSQSLRASGNAEKAGRIYDAFKKLHDSEDVDLANAEEYLQIISQNAERYTVTETSINSPNTDFGGFLQDGHFYFSSSREQSGRQKAVDPWTKQSTLDVFEVSYNRDTGVFGQPKPLAIYGSPELHISSFVMDKTGKTAYFTRSVAPQNKGGTHILKIFKAHYIEGFWANTQELPFNSNAYSNAHPALSPDGKKMYFASNRPGGFGLTDIYVVELFSDGTFGDPENLGNKVNSKGRESFPFISGTNELYFASDGHFGMGGYDIYYYNLEDSDNGNLLNVGLPVNGAADDYAFSIDFESQKGFFSSNRSGKDNMYQFTEQIAIREYLGQKVRGSITDFGAGIPIRGVKIAVFDENGNLLGHTSTDAKGFYELDFKQPGNGYILSAQGPGFEGVDRLIDVVKGVVQVDFSLKTHKPRMREATRLAERDGVEYLDFDKVFFEHNSSFLNAEAKVKLLAISKMLIESPWLKVKINAHADMRGTDAYNDWLTERRGKRIKDFLAQLGISGDRLRYEGLGKKELLRPCNRLEDCDEEDHKENRRTVFLISNGEDWVENYK